MVKRARGDYNRGIMIASVLIPALIVFATVIAMECVAWSSHKYVMHGFGWGWHRDHHEPHDGFYEKNDLYAIVGAALSIGFFMIGIPGEVEEDVRQTFELAKELDLDRWSWSIYSPLPGSPLYDELIAEGRIKPFALDHERIHFTEAYDGVCAIPPDRLKQIYGEINDHFTRRQLAA